MRRQSRLGSAWAFGDEESEHANSIAVFEHYDIVSGTDLRDAVARLDLAVGKELGKVAPFHANGLRRLAASS